MDCTCYRCRLERQQDEIERLRAQRDAYRSVAIEWYSIEGPFPENLADTDVVVDVDARAADAAGGDDE